MSDSDACLVCVVLLVSLKHSSRVRVLFLLQAIKELAPALSEVDITLMLATSDRDSDGCVTFGEFKAMMLLDKDNDLAYWDR